MKRQPRNHWGIIFAFSSDHAGIGGELQKLEDQMYQAVCRIDDARDVRRYLESMRRASIQFGIDENVAALMK